MNDLNPTETMSEDAADKAVWEAAKAEAPHPYEGNIGVGEYTKNGDLNKISQNIIDEVCYRVDSEIEAARYAIDEYINELKEGATENIKADMTEFVADKYNLSYEDADVIIKGCGDFDLLDDVIDSKVEMEFDYLNANN